MAEERLIDDDKDRKYKIRINENGEEELVLNENAGDEPPEELLEQEILEFEVEESAESEESAAKANAEAEQKRARALSERIERAKSLIEDNDFSGAAYVLEEAEALGASAEIYSLKVQTLTEKYTDFSKTAQIYSALNALQRYGAESVKKDCAAYMPQLTVRSGELKAQTEKLNAQNEEQKAERREIYAPKRKKWAFALAATAVPLVICAVLAIIFGTMIYAQKDSYANMILCFVFSGLAAACFAACLLEARKLWENSRILKLNEKNTATKLGRELDLKRAELETINEIIAVYGGN